MDVPETIASNLLAAELQLEFAGQQGFSKQNLKYMRALAEAWPETAILQPPAAQKPGRITFVQAPLAQTVASIVHQPDAQLPWKHHCLLLDKLTSPVDRLWHAAKAVEHGWSRNVLALQIDSKQPSIGLILCRSKNRVIAEYALRDLSKPIGVSGYVTRLIVALPKSLKGSAPSIAELEKGLDLK